jgi:hypothetical protein
MTATGTVAGAGWRSRFGYRVGAALAVSVLLNVGLVSIATAVGVAPGFRPVAVVPVALLSVMAMHVVVAAVCFSLLPETR